MPNDVHHIFTIVLLSTRNNRLIAVGRLGGLQ